MRNFIKFTFIALVLISCNQAHQADIYGTWTTLDIVDNTGMDIKDKVDFNKDGTYTLVMISGQDSIVSQMNGTFLVSDNNQELKITTNGISFTHTIESIEKDLMKIKDKDGHLIRMKRIKQ